MMIRKRWLVFASQMYRKRPNVSLMLNQGVKCRWWRKAYVIGGSRKTKAVLRWWGGWAKRKMAYVRASVVLSSGFRAVVGVHCVGRAILKVVGGRGCKDINLLSRRRRDGYERGRILRDVKVKGWL